VGFTFLGKHDLSCTSVMNKLKKNFSIVVNRRLHWDLLCRGWPGGVTSIRVLHN
jgi:hypothetical protein